MGYKWPCIRNSPLDLGETGGLSARVPIVLELHFQGGRSPHLNRKSQSMNARSHRPSETDLSEKVISQGCWNDQDMMGADA